MDNGMRGHLFVQHIEQHIANGDTGDVDHKAMCKICNKTIDEICGDNKHEAIRMKVRAALKLLSEKDKKEFMEEVMKEMFSEDFLSPMLTKVLEGR